MSVYVLFQRFCDEDSLFLGVYSSLEKSLDGVLRYTHIKAEAEWSEPDSDGYRKLRSGAIILTAGDGGLISFVVRAVELDTAVIED